MRTLNIVLLLLLLTIMYVRPNHGVRVLNMKELRLQALDKGPVAPSGPSGCTFIPGSGGTHCPIEEMNVAGHVKHHHHSSAST